MLGGFYIKLNQNLFKKVDKLLIPIFKKVLNYDSIKEQERILEGLVLELLKNSTNAFKLYGSFNKTHNKIAKIHNLGELFEMEVLFEDKEIPHFLIYEYLILSEGIFSKQIDIISYLLVESGIEFEYKAKGKIKYRKTVAQIQEAYLSKKLIFLGDNGFSIFIKYYDNELRNAIAHIDYLIDNKGIIIFKERKLTIEQFDKKNNNLLELTHSIHESFRRYYKNYCDNFPYDRYE